MEGVSEDFAGEEMASFLGLSASSVNRTWSVTGGAAEIWNEEVNGTVTST